MARIDQSSLRGKIRDLPISRELEQVLLKAAGAAGIDVIFVTSGGQPGTSGRSVGSTRHNGGRAADLQLIVDGRTLSFSDLDGGETVERYVTAAAAHGANGIGAGVGYMGPQTLHIGFGADASDHRRIVWGAGGKAKNAPQWLRDAAERGWNNPPAWVFATADRPTTEDEREESHALVMPEIPKRFNIDVVRAAQATQRRLGIPASVTLAQWAVESAYGTRMPAGSNNPFGIKAKAGQPNVLAWTKEEIGGKMVSVQAAFRAFSSLEEAFVEHGQLLAFGRPYETARKFKNNPDRFADALTGVYATDSNYGNLLKSIMRSNDLYRFDQIIVPDVPAHDLFLEDDMSRPLQQGDVDMVRVKALQQRLVDLGYKLGKIDGKFGKLTTGALLSFQNENGLATTGILDEATERALRTAGHRSLDGERVTASESDLAEAGSRIVVDAGRSRILNWITGTLGGLGVANSAVMNAAGTAAARTGAVPDGLLPFLSDVQKLNSTSPASEFTRLSGIAQNLTAQFNAPTLPPELVQLAQQLRRALPPDLLSKNPDIVQAFDAIARTGVRPPQQMTTVLDILPGFFANDTVLQTVMKGVAATGASILPGFGGSLAVLGLGLAGRYFANRIAAARVEDHREGGNINPLK